VNGTERTVRIMELRWAGWSETRIAGDMGISRQRVHELLLRYGPEIRRLRSVRLEASLTARINAVGLVRDDLAGRLATVNRRLTIWGRELEILREQTQDDEIDRLAGILEAADARDKMQGLLSTKSTSRAWRESRLMQGGNAALAAETPA